MLAEQGPTGRGSGSSSSFPAPSPLGSPGLSYDGGLSLSSFFLSVTEMFSGD